MFPEHVPTAWQTDPSLAAEGRVREALRSQLSDDYSVLWRVPLYDERSRNPDTEADFVILHSSYGLLVIEVKGGGVERDGPEWFSTDRHGERHAIVDPFRQATRCKHVLVRQLRELPRLRNRFIAAAHAVVLPDSGRPGSASDLGSNAPLALIAFADALEALGAFVTRVMREAAAVAGSGFGVDGVREAEAKLAPRFKLAHPLQAILSADDAELITLTEEQFNVLDLVGREPRVLITGGAGTGKTLLAVELAQRLSARGVRTLLTTASPALAAWLRALCPGTDALLVSALGSIDQELLRHAADRHLIDDDQVQALAKDRFGKAMTERWLVLVDGLPELRFDAVIVDEAQDLLSEHWTGLSCCLNEPDDGQLYAFCDEAQLDEGVEITNLPAEPPYRLSPMQARLPSRFVEITLSDNLRNTQRIFALARPLYLVPGGVAGAYRCRGPVGEQVELVEALAWRDVRKRLVALLKRLISEEKIHPRDIAVLYYSGFTDGGGRTLPWQNPSEPSGSHDPSDLDIRWLRSMLSPTTVAELTIAHAPDFRGMERPVVIIVGSPATDREAYIGLTRARVYLALIGAADELSAWGAHAQWEDDGRG